MELLICGVGSGGDCLCKHIVASVFALQDGVIESKITLGKTATARITVTETNTAKAVGSGNLDVFATPMMIALMEHAACDCLAEGIEPGQTSVGTHINVSHVAASPIGTEITATATIEYVFGRKVEFMVTAADGTKEIGNGKHTRVIVDAERFIAKANKEKP
ncbi:MAG: thioesterase family protein [Firmicutes bacterium]|nr:thioesterase family protein [Bacillota bacterium]